jgi:hypothetical protein
MYLCSLPIQAAVTAYGEVGCAVSLDMAASRYLFRADPGRTQLVRTILGCG